MTEPEQKPPKLLAFGSYDVRQVEQFLSVPAAQASRPEFWTEQERRLLIPAGVPQNPKVVNHGEG